MGRIPLSQLEKVQELPYQIGLKKNAKTCGVWFYRNNIRHDINGISMYKTIRRIIKSHIGKSFNQAFYKFCQIAPVYQQKFFLEEFNGKYKEYDVDENGLIKLVINPSTRFGWDKINKSEDVIFYSIDYKTEIRHIKTGEKLPIYSWKLNKHKKHMYQEVIISGFSITFETKKDTKYKRLNAEKNKLLKKRDKEWKRVNKNTIDEQTFRNVLNAKKQKEKADDLVKILSHGFDPITSFRKEKLK
jgi:hypothetical protein